MTWIANERIRHNGKFIEKGKVVSGLKQQEEKRLSSLGAIKAIEVSKENNSIKEQSEEYKQLASALDQKYNRDLLAQAAKEANVEFANTAKKDEIIDAIISQGKAEELLKDEEK